MLNIIKNNRLLKSGFWSYVETGSGQIFSIVTLLYIARAVGPEEFGVVAVASAWAMLFQSFTEAGIGDAIVQRQDKSEEIVSTAFWLNLGLGTLGAVIVVILTCTISFSSNGQSNQYLAALAMCIPIIAAGNIPTSLLRADLRNKDLARRGILSDIAGCIAGITCARYGMGGWAIVIQNIVSNLVKTLAVWKCSSWVPTRVFVPSEARNILKYGYKSLGAGLLSSMSARTDRFFLGYFFPAREVGVYSIASEGVARGSNVLIMGLSQVMFPHYASLQNNPAALKDSFYKSLFWCCLIGSVANGCLYAICPLLTMGIMGDKWTASIDILKVLSFLGVMQCTFIVPMTLYKSVGRPGLAFFHALSQVILNVAVILVFKSWGILAVAMALAARPILSIGIHVFTIQFILPQTKILFMKSILPGLFVYASLVLFAKVLAAGHQNEYLSAILVGILGVFCLLGFFKLSIKKAIS
jgi:O-antigen/teichoic acid export membrane protein